MNPNSPNDPRGPLPDEPGVKRRYTPEEAGHDIRRKPVSRARRRRCKGVNVGVLIVSAIFAVVIGISLFIIISGKKRPEVIYPDTTAADAATEPLESVDDGRSYYTVTIASDQIYYGDLILVNAATEYRFPAEAENSIVNISEYKNEYYLMADPAARLSKNVVDRFNTLCTDYYAYNGFRYMQVNSAYRSREEQINVYNSYAQSNGEDYAKAYVATPGYSEHHTGLALDLNINRGGSISYVESDEGAAWFRDNAKNYGFILRYPSDKVYMTGISYESWHYRYVGLPHSQIISDMNMCLEEYEQYLKKYTYDTDLIAYSADTGVMYVDPESELSAAVLVYYAPSDGDKTEVKVPKGYTYEISGNNTDGFVITATREGE